MTASVLDLSGFELGDAPADDNDATPFDGPTCEVCGVALEYSGKGRKPKRCDDHKRQRAATGSRTTSDVKSALAVLDQMYGAVSLGLLMVSPPSASVWASQLEQLQATNALVLAGDKALTKSICRLGERTGKAMFVGAHVMALVPVVGALNADFKSRPRKAPKTPKTAPAQSAPEPEQSGTDFRHLNPRFDLS